MDSVIDFFSRTVRENANKVAVCTDNECITYAELYDMSNKVGNYLIQHHLGNGALVAIILERSVEMISAIMGVMKSGAAYLIIDPKYPAKRIEYMLQDSGCAYLITSSTLKEALTYEYGGTSILIEPALQTTQLTIPHVATDSNSLIYVIYTSGSTGTPKGVMVEHGGVVNMALSYINRFHVSSTDRVLQFASMSFAASVIEIYITLLSGASLYIVPDTEKMNHQLFKDYLSHYKISLALLPPNYISSLDPENISLRVLITAGSQTSWKIVERWCKYLSYYNVYGCSETSTGISAYCADLNNKKTRDVPIGAPNPNTELYILNENNEAVSVDEIGELCVSGICLARGYLNNPELTDKKFVFYSPAKSKRIYRTGDLARLSAEGEIEIVGRIDDQVKINGYRIELGEVNNVIAEHSLVSDSIVVAIKMGNSDMLCAYCVCSSIDAIPSIKTHLSEHLPDYMIPRFIVLIDAIPLNINGKVDKESLPRPTDMDGANMEKCLPRNMFELTIFQIWRDVLNVISDELSVFDNYFFMGGDSITAIQIVSLLYKTGYEIDVQDVFSYPTIASLAELLECAKRIDKPKEDFSHHHLNAHVSEYLIEKAHDHALRNNIILDGSLVIDKAYALSPMQSSLYLSYVKSRDSQYIVHNEFILRGQVNVEKIENCIKIIVSRHDILRSIFTHYESEYPLQVVMKNFSTKFHVIDISQTSEILNENKIIHWVNSDRKNTFDLESENAVRFTLIRWGEEAYSLIICYHHIVMDGWCQNIFWSELQALYAADDAALAGNIYEPVPYSNFINWLQVTDEEKSIEYWKKYLSDYSSNANTIVTADRSGLAISYCSEIFEVDAETTRLIIDVCKEHQITVSCLLKTLWGIMLQDVFKTDDVVFGEVVAGRPPHLEDAEKIMGLFVNTLPVRITKIAAQKLNQLAQTVQRQTIASQKHQFLSLSKIQSLSPVKNNLIDHIFVYENFPSISSDFNINKDKFDVELGYELDEVSYDLNVSVSVSNKIRTRILYRDPIYDASKIQFLYQKFFNLIDVAKSGINIDIESAFKASNYLSSAPILTGNTVTIPNLSVHALFEQQVKLTPDYIAITMACTDTVAKVMPIYGMSLSYSELNKNANQLARELLNKEISTGDVIAIYLDRSTDYIVTLFAILKTGAAYLPLDKSYDDARVIAILETAKPKYVICRELFSEVLSHRNINLLDIDKMCTFSKDYSEENIVLNVMPDLAQVLFTSGTTGVPKGVQIAHSNLVNHAFFIKEKMSLTAQDRILQFACLGFDAFSEELFPSLFSGAAVVLRPSNLLESFDYLTELISASGITLLDLPTSYWNHWVDALVDDEAKKISLDRLRKIILGGESISPKHVSLWQKYFPSIQIVNSYGPTETTIICSWYEVPLMANENIKIPIGTPINNSQFYILNSNMKSVNIGETGELFVGGAGVSRGYLNLPDVSAKVFLAGSIAGDDSQVVYRTGDLVYVDTETKQMYYVGRANDQVKIRGYRVDLGDVKNLINSHPLIRQSCVVLHEDNSEKQIRAYVQADPDSEVEIIRADLYATLPKQIAPSEIFFISSWPLNTNGKIDLKALAKLCSQAPKNISQTIITPSQQVILDVWNEVLGKSVRDIDGSFFELGGHSLQAISLLTKIKRHTGVKLTVDILFKFPTVRLLAEQVTSNSPKDNARKLAVLLSTTHNSSQKDKMFFFPPVGGGIFCYKILAGLLESKYVCYGLNDIDERGNLDNYETISDIAKKYLVAIKSIQDHGPYHLSGWSMGGVIAQEVACILESTGEQVESLTLIDTWHPHVLPKSESNATDIEYKFIYDFVRSIHERISCDFDYSILYGIDIKTAWDLLVENEIISKDLEYELFNRYYLTYKNNQQALVGHSPRQYQGSAILFQSKQPKRSIDNPPLRLGWDSCIQEIDTVLTESDHYGQLMGDTVHKIAGKIMLPVDSTAE